MNYYGFFLISTFIFLLANTSDFEKKYLLSSTVQDNKISAKNANNYFKKSL